MIGRGRSGLWDIVELLSGMTGRTVGERTGCEASTGPGLVHPQQSTGARPPTIILRLYLESGFCRAYRLVTSYSCRLFPPAWLKKLDVSAGGAPALPGRRLAL